MVSQWHREHFAEIIREDLHLEEIRANYPHLDLFGPDDEALARQLFEQYGATGSAYSRVLEHARVWIADRTHFCDCESAAAARFEYHAYGE